MNLTSWVVIHELRTMNNNTTNNSGHPLPFLNLEQKLCHLGVEEDPRKVLMMAGSDGVSESRCPQ